MLVYESRRYRRAETYTDYAKDLCTNYKIDLHRYNLCVAQKRYIEGKSVRKYEDLRPDNGEWIVDYKRSIHYNHSTFTDLVITGLVGIRPEDNDDTLTINPLFEADDMEYFTLENVSYRGHNITVTYDKSGEHYGIGKGMRVYIDGRLMAESASLGALAVSLSVG